MLSLHDFITESNDIEELRDLLLGGEDPNQQDRTGRTPLHLAVMKCERNPEERDEILLAAEELIKFEADVNLANHMERTPLHLAVGCRNYKMTKMLLQYNAEINLQDYEGYTALHFATSMGIFGGDLYELDLSIVKLLLKYDPNIDIKVRNGQTALMLAALNNNFPIVREILKKNASVILKDSNGNSAMHYALHAPEVNRNIVFELLYHGSSFNVLNHVGMSPITLYMVTLRNASNIEVENVLFVFKHYVFKEGDFNDFHRKYIREISTKINYPLLQFILLCQSEIKKMRLDKVGPNFFVYDLASKGGSSKLSESINHVPFEVFDKVLDKLIKREYPFYHDLIASGICSPYISKEFIKMCCMTKMGDINLNYDVFRIVSSYLTNFEMVNMMIACSGGWRRHWYLPRFTYYTRCSIS